MLDLMPALAAWPPAATGERCAVATVVMADGGSRRESFGYSAKVVIPDPASYQVAQSDAVAARLLGAGPIHHISAPQHQEMPWT